MSNTPPPTTTSSSSSLSLMDSLFQRTLDDLIKGIRIHSPTDNSTPLTTFLTKSMDEIRREIKSTDPSTKSTALLKLTYLSTHYGFDMSWASFHAVEVISYPPFPLKKIGYLAIATSFQDTTDVILLITNQLRKDLSSCNEFEVGLALQTIAVVGSPDLCRDLCNSVFLLLSSSKSYIRKRAVGVVARVFTKYPDAVRVCFKRLVENLECSESHSVCSAMNVFCELVVQDPKGYLPLAPEFYRILVDCKVNWVVIKVLKVFAKLVPLERRLGSKIVEPICQLMRKTAAKSVLVECIRTVVSSLSDYEPAVRLAALKVKEELLGQDDPNLRYLGLQALSGLAREHVWAVVENKDVVVKSLSDADPNIKLAALHLVMAMVCEDNVAEIAKVLVSYALKSDPEFCNEILRSILETCRGNYYEIVFDFDWYVLLLGEMTRIPHCQTGVEIESQFVDIGLRVKDARPELVNVARDLLIDPALLGNPFLHSILSAAAWVSGEYVEFSRNPYELMEALLQPRTNLLPPSIRAVYIQSALKVLVFCLQSYLWQQVEAPVHNDVLTSGDLTSELFEESGNEVSTGEGLLGNVTSTRESLVKLLNISEKAMVPLSISDHVELQERARNVLAIVQLVKQEIFEGGSERKECEASETVKVIADLFAEELGPVSVSAQARLTVPDGLTLQDDLSELDMIYRDIQLHPLHSFALVSSYSGEKEVHLFSDEQSRDNSESSAKSASMLAQHRQKNGLYYLPSEKDNEGSNDCTPVDESNLLDGHGNVVDDLVKLTEHSLSIKKKPNHAKPRPVVVRLDEGESFIPKKKLGSTNDLLSTAVRDVLMGTEEVSTSTRNLDDASRSREKKGKEKVGIDHLPDRRERSESGNPSSRRNTHKSYGKEKKDHHLGRNEEGTEESSRKEKKKSSRHRHSRNKTERKEGESNLVVQSAQIPDFLL